jgi:monovalent cation:H+ antiporter-2, CPA2 family
MDHEPVLISTIAIGLTAAFIGGFVARRIGLPAIVGYIVAGIAIGPFTPGLVADPSIATELAELGVILLMFGVGIHFSFRDLVAVRSTAIPGAVIQVGILTALGTALGLGLGYGTGGALVLGLAVSVASTVVLLRALEDRSELDTEQGRIAVGWLIVQDLFMVVILVLLPVLAPTLGGDPSAAQAPDVGSGAGALVQVLIAVGRAAIFAVLMVVAGARLIPWLLLQVARLGSRELFTLSVLAVALGIAYAASTLFGVSFALGAFLAGLVVSESDMSHQAAADALPLRDAFAVLFFVSVGMLLDPTYLLANPFAVVAVVALIVIAQPLVALAIVLVLGHPSRVGLTVAAGLGQIGEFSFILGTLGVSLGLLPTGGFQLIVAGALLSITLNPVLFALIEPLDARLRDRRWLVGLMRRRIGSLASIGATQRASLVNHAVICGYGRVGRLIGPALERRGFRYAVVTQQRDEVDRLRAAGVVAIYGDAAHTEVLQMANVAAARLVVVATSEPNETRLIVERVRALDPGVDIVVRTHSDSEAAHLRSLGGKVQAVHGDRELAVQMARYALRRFGLSSAEAEAVAQGLRGRAVVSAEPRRRPLEGAVQRLRERISAR